MPERKVIEMRSKALLNEMRDFVSGTRGLAIVKAPPGSGKTFLLLQLVDQAVELKLRVAIAAQTNSQADDICDRLARDYPYIPTFRFVASGKIPDDSATFAHIFKTHELPTAPAVVVATTAKWGMVDTPSPSICSSLTRRGRWGGLTSCCSGASQRASFSSATPARFRRP
jgi:hypothetical protein